MKNRKILVFSTILLLAIGFATVSIVFYVKGKVHIEIGELKFVSSIYFTDVSINGGTIESGENSNTLTFTTNEFNQLDTSSIITYKIKNTSNYDGKVTGITCKFYNEETSEYDISSNDYISFTHEYGFYPKIVTKNSTTDSTTLTIKQIKSFPSSEKQTVKYQCVIDATTDTEAEATGDTKDIKLYDLIKSNVKGTITDFSKRSGDETNPTNGIYKTTATENNVPVYYYRGNVDNNVIFNNMCWKIIRTTVTGGVKLIYNGVPTNETCNNTGDATQIGTSFFNTHYYDNADIGYMYGTELSDNYDDTHANINDSVVKSTIDTWYSTNFTDENIKNKIEDTIYCNDRSIIDGVGYGYNHTHYGVRARASGDTKNLNPSLVCPLNNDKFTVSASNGNGALTYPVGLITLDEAVFAGFNSYVSNNEDYIDLNNYLNTGIEFWTMSPDFIGGGGHGYSNAYVGTIESEGNIGGSNVSDTGECGVRPVISLVNDARIYTTGTGTTTNPYVIK